MSISLKNNYILFLLGFFLIQTALLAQFDIPEKPTKKNPDSVYDYIGLLSKGEKATLENKLIKYSDTTSTQIVVAIVNSINGEEIGYLATKWAHKWGIGQEKEDNGIFILLAQKDRKITIRTGYGVEHLLTDYISRQIIEYNIAPNFKQGKYFAGLNSAVNSIFKVLQGEYKSTRKRNSGNISPLIIFIIFISIVFIIIILSNKGNKGNRGGRNYRRQSDSRDIFETIILTNSGRGGFGGGSFGGSGGFGGSSGGGFGGGFGGGGFGGGGASGGW